MEGGISGHADRFIQQTPSSSRRHWPTVRLVDTLTGLYSRHRKGLQTAGRGALVVLLACMPWAVLSPQASPPSHWAGGMHVGALAMLSVPACVSFTSPWSRAGAVMFVFGYSGLMEVLQHFSPGRTGSWEDLGMNAVGVLIGVGLAKWAMMSDEC